MGIYRKVGQTKYHIGQVEAHDTLPVKAFLLNADGTLSDDPNHTIPKRLYGSVEEDVAFYLKTLEHPDYNTNPMGLWFSGLKGSGKTTTSRLLADKVNLPILTTHSRVPPDVLYSVLNQLPRVCLKFEDYDKFYAKDEFKEELLPVLDGSIGKNNVYILTTNSHEISEYMMSRLGRLLIHQAHYGVEDEDTRDEVIDHLLQNEEFRQSIVDVTDILCTYSIESLEKLIKQVDWHKMNAFKVVEKLNLKVEHQTFIVTGTLKGKRITGICNHNPLTNGLLWFRYEHTTPDRERSYWREDYLHDKIDLYEMTRDENKMVFTRKGNNSTILYFTPKIVKRQNIFEN